MSKSIATSTAIIFTLVRYLVKRTGSIVYSVRSINEQGESHDYLVTLNRNGSHTCSCEGNATYHRQCKHIKYARSQELARIRKASEPMLATIAENVKASIAREHAQAAAQPRKESEQQRIATLDLDAVPLSGNKGFSVLKR